MSIVKMDFDAFKKPFLDLKFNCLNTIDSRKGSLKCKHFNCNCLIYSPCCNEFFYCHRCHNEANKCANILEAKSIDKILCINCKTVQEITNKCIKCNAKFGRYYCLDCKIWSNIPNTFYHCDGCKICKLGSRDEYIHCYTCGNCYPKSYYKTHVCIENRLDDKCCFCLEKLNYSHEPVILSQFCIHAYHKTCFICLKDRAKALHKPFTCLICNKHLLKR